MSDKESKVEDSIDQQEDTSTPYDDVFRTMNEDCPRFVIPLINEIFGTDYPLDAKVEFLADKHIINLPGRRHVKRETDSNISVTDDDGNARYHIECQSTPDNAISIRIYEYDARTAMNGGKLIGNRYRVRFPYSAVLYLRSNESTLDEIYIDIETPGGDVSYPVPIVKLKNYNLDEIFEKKLWFLIPFYLFKYEGDLPAYENDEQLRREMLSEFRDISNRLEQLCNTGEMTSRESCILLELSDDVVQNLASKYENIRNEVKEIMGGRVIELKAVTAWNEGLSQGLSQGRTMDIRNLMSSLKFTAEQAMDALKIPQEDRETYMSGLNEEELKEG